MPKMKNTQVKKPINSFKDLDYSPIPNHQKWNTIRYVTVGFGLSALASIFLVIIGGVGLEYGRDSVFGGFAALVFLINGILIIPLVLASIISGVIMLFTTDNYVSKYIPDFAKANGFGIPPGFQINTDGSIFSVGDSPTQQNLVTGIYRGFEFELYQHNYWTGSGKNRTKHTLSILNLKLPKKVPHLVINSKIEDSTGFSGSVLPVLFLDNQKITLEGDFSKYFDVYSPKNYQVSALSLLTPDVMQTFLTRLHQVDVELVNDRLYIYDPDPLNSAEQIADMFEAADAVIDEWSGKLKRANIYANKQQEQIHVGENAEPAKLKRGGLVATIIGVSFVLIINVMRIIIETTDDPRFTTPVAFVIFGIISAAVVGVIINLIVVARRRTAFTKRYGKIKD